MLPLTFAASDRWMPLLHGQHIDPNYFAEITQLQSSTLGISTHDWTGTGTFWLFYRYGP